MASPPLMISPALARYRICEKLGGGGMGVVYKAQDNRLGRFVALKFLPHEIAGDSHALQRFRREAYAVSALNHPNICTVYDMEEIEGQAFISMEYLEGKTLREVVEGGALALDQIVSIGSKIANGLAAAHSEGILHRDIKSANIIVTKSGMVKILDFGLAKITRDKADPSLDATETRDADMTTGRAIVGTVAYMSPEQALGKPLDARSDLFSFGIILYEMATGCLPFHGETTTALLLSIVQEEPRPPIELNPNVPTRLQEIIKKCLEKDYALRYQRAIDIGSDLLELAGESGRHGTAGVLDDATRKITIATGKRKAVASASATFRSKWRKYLRRRWKLALESAVLAAMVSGAATYSFVRGKHILTDKDTVVLADFVNSTGDPVFDGTLRQGLGVELEQSPFLSLVSDLRLQQTLRLMAQAPDARITPQLAREVCLRIGSRAYIYGSIVSFGNQYVLGLKAVNCRTGDPLAQGQVTADTKERVLKALGEAAAGLRQRLGESLASIQTFDTPLEQATTASLDALKAYSEGRISLYRKADQAAAVLWFQKAIRLDPQFAMAYASLATSYVNLGETKLAAETTIKAFELRDHVSEHEKFYIDTHYYHLAIGDLLKARQVYELWAQTYPRDSVPLSNLGLIDQSLGQYDKAMEERSEALRLVETSGQGYANLAHTYITLNRVDDASATIRQAKSKNLDSPDLRFYEYQLAFLQHDKAAMAQQITFASGKLGVEDVMLAYQSDAAAYFGQLRKARELSGVAVAAANQAEKRETAANYEAYAAVREALFGNVNEAENRAAAALSVSVDRGSRYGAALALAIAGDTRKAQTLTNQLETDFPNDTVVEFNYLPTLRAQLALNSNDAGKAIDILQTAVRYELGLPTSGSAFAASALYPIYVRGSAYLASKRGSEAATEFQKILDHPGVVVSEPIGALAQLDLGRSYALLGDKARARAAYADFLNLWKEADNDVPILDQARLEYLNLA